VNQLRAAASVVSSPVPTSAVATTLPAKAFGPFPVQGISNGAGILLPGPLLVNKSFGPADSDLWIDSSSNLHTSPMGQLPVQYLGKHVGDYFFFDPSPPIYGIL
jgi:hypothetical protein